MIMTLSCKICDRQYDNKILLEVHNSVYHREGSNKDDDQRNCPHCGQVLTRNDSLFRHILNIHYKLKQYKCPICRRAFASSYNMKQHIFSHSDAYEFECPKCPKNFKTRRNVVKHLKRSHELNKVDLDKVCMEYRLGIKDSDINTEGFVDSECVDEEFGQEKFKDLEGFEDYNQSSCTTLSPVSDKTDHNQNKSQNIGYMKDSLNKSIEYKTRDCADVSEESPEQINNFNDESEKSLNHNAPRNVYPQVNDVSKPLLHNNYIDLNNSNTHGFTRSIQNHHNIAGNTARPSNHVNNMQNDLRNDNEKMKNRSIMSGDRIQYMNEMQKLISKGDVLQSIQHKKTFHYYNDNNNNNINKTNNNNKRKIDNIYSNYNNDRDIQKTEYRFLNSTDAYKLQNTYNILQSTDSKNKPYIYKQRSLHGEQKNDLENSCNNNNNSIFENQEVEELREICGTETGVAYSNEADSIICSENTLLEKLTELHNMGGEFDGFKQIKYEISHCISSNTDQSQCSDFTTTKSQQRVIQTPSDILTNQSSITVPRSADNERVTKLTISPPPLFNDMLKKSQDALVQRSLSPACEKLAKRFDCSYQTADDQPMVYILED